MRKVSAIALVVLSLSAAPAGALEVKNVRSTYGPFGALRASNKLLPGDILFLGFDIHDMKMEPNTGLVKYRIRLEVFDGKGKSLFKRDTDTQRYLALGQARLADRAQVITGSDQPAGNYSVKVTITETAGKDKAAGAGKSFTHPFEILPAGFGLIHGSSPAVAPVTDDLTAHCALVGFRRDPKTKLPNVNLRMRILDEKGQPTLSAAFINNIPKDLPEEVDIKKIDIVPLPFPIFLNRPGRFTIEIIAQDLNSKKTATLTFPLLVVETTQAGGQ